MTLARQRFFTHAMLLHDYSRSLYNIIPHAGVNTHQQDEPGGLPGNGAGSSKQRNGGSVYDMLVQEIKATKLQQKTLARQLQELQQNLSGTSQEALSQVGSLREELAEIRQQVSHAPCWLCPCGS